MKNTHFTISTLVFESLEDAKLQLEKWEKEDIVRKGTKIFQVTRIWYPKKEITLQEGKL